MKKDKTIEDYMKDLEKILNHVEEAVEDITYIKENVLDEYDRINGIFDIENFVYQLKLNDLYSEEIEKFIYEYLKYKN